MATIYRFIVENQIKSGGKGLGVGGKKKPKKGHEKTLLQLLGDGKKGGVEANRKLRAVNPLLNRITGGYWEKGTRIGRAGLGLVKFKQNGQTGKMEFAGLSGVAIAIIVAFCIQTIMKHHAKLITKEKAKNERNFKALENGIGGINGSYNVAVNAWSGRITYNQNK